MCVIIEYNEQLNADKAEKENKMKYRFDNAYENVYVKNGFGYEFTSSYINANITSKMKESAKIRKMEELEETRYRFDEESELYAKGLLCQ